MNDVGSDLWAILYPAFISITNKGIPFFSGKAHSWRVPLDVQIPKFESRWYGLVWLIPRSLLFGKILPRVETWVQLVFTYLVLVREIGFQHLRVGVFSLVKVTPQIWGGELATFPLRANHGMRWMKCKKLSLFSLHVVPALSHFPLLLYLVFQSYKHDTLRTLRDIRTNENLLPIRTSKKRVFDSSPMSIDYNFFFETGSFSTSLNTYYNIHWHQARHIRIVTNSQYLSVIWFRNDNLKSWCQNEKYNPQPWLLATTWNGRP